MGNLSLDKKTSIYYSLIDGDPEKPTLVFLHEGLGCVALWKEFPELLCRRTGCPGLVYDRSGYGKSSPLGKIRAIHYLHDYALYELPKVIHSLIPNRQFILVGHSDGGSIGCIFAAERPVNLRGMITEATHVFVEPETIRGIAIADAAYKEGKLGALKNYHGDKTHTLFKAWANTWLSDWFTHWNIEYLLPSIECDFLVLQGCNDQYATVKQVDSIVSKTAGRTESLIIENAAHSPHFEQTESVLQTMASFIQQIG